MVLCDQVAELFDDCINELLAVSVRLPELCKNVVLPVALPHSTERRWLVNGSRITHLSQSTCIKSEVSRNVLVSTAIMYSNS